MRRPWRIISVSGGVVAVFTAALLIMGSFDSESRLTAEDQLTRVENLARYWESRLNAARSEFRSLLLRYDVGEIVEHPSDFSNSRIQQRLIYIHRGWPIEVGNLRGILLFSCGGQVREIWGDTLGGGAANRALYSRRDVDMMFVSTPGDSVGALAICYRVAPSDSNPVPGYMISLFEPRSVLGRKQSSVQNWRLCTNEGLPVLTEANEAANTSLAGISWMRMNTQDSGVMNKADGSALVYSKVHVPGMAPLLLINKVPSRTATGILAMLLMIAGTTAAVAGSRNPRPKTGISETVHVESLTEEDGVEAVSYRAIFQNLCDPICIVNGKGRVVRANRLAEELLQYRQKHANDSYRLKFPDGELGMKDSLCKLAGSAESQTYPLQISASGQTLFAGSVDVIRFRADAGDHGPVLLHFHEQASTPSPILQEADGRDVIPDPQSPYPVMYVTQEGLIQLYNEAALRACPRIKDTPVIAEVLPSLEARELSVLLESESRVAFESLFGSGPHSFEVVPVEDGVLLYAHPLSASQTLEVALEQSQENFNTLCAVLPLPVLLVDPRSHAVNQANAAAQALFKLTAEDFQGRIFDSLSPEPMNLSSSNHEFVADTPDGPIPCRARFEMVKIEGVPTIMAMLEPPAESYSSLAKSLAQSSQLSGDHNEGAESREVAHGPTVLVSLSPSVRDVGRKLLESTGHGCEVFSSLDDATAWLFTHDIRPELLAIDVSDYPEAADWLEDIRLRHGNVACMAITDGVTYGLTAEGRNAYLVKPFDLETLSETLRYLGLSVHPVESETAANR